MPRYIHSDSEMVYACPECDSVPVYRRERKNTTFDRDKEFVCYECKTGFDEPVERERKRHGSNPDTMPDDSAFESPQRKIAREKALEMVGE